MVHTGNGKASRKWEARSTEQGPGRPHGHVPGPRAQVASWDFILNVRVKFLTPKLPHLWPGPEQVSVLSHSQPTSFPGAPHWDQGPELGPGHEPAGGVEAPLVAEEWARRQTRVIMIRFMAEASPGKRTCPEETPTHPRKALWSVDRSSSTRGNGPARRLNSLAWGGNMKPTLITEGLQGVSGEGAQKPDPEE